MCNILTLRDDINFYESWILSSENNDIKTDGQMNTLFLDHKDIKAGPSVESEFSKKKVLIISMKIG